MKKLILFLALLLLPLSVYSIPPGGIDWTVDQGATNIHSGNLPDLSGTYLTLTTPGGVKLDDSTPDAPGETGFATDKYIFFGGNSESIYFRPGSTSDNVIFGSDTGAVTWTFSGITANFGAIGIGTSLQFRVSGGVSQYSIDGGTTWYAIQSDALPVIASAATGTGNINIDGVSASHYRYSNGASAATYTPVITSAPPAGTERYVLLTVGGGVGVCTMTWTNVTWLGSAGAAATTTEKKSTYACIIPESGNAQCKIVAEAY